MFITARRKGKKDWFEKRHFLGYFCFIWEVGEVHSSNVCRSWDWARAEPTDGNSVKCEWEKPNHLRHHLLPSWVHNSKKLQVGAGTEYPMQALQCVMHTAHLHHQAKHPLYREYPVTGLNLWALEKCSRVWFQMHLEDKRAMWFQVLLSRAAWVDLSSCTSICFPLSRSLPEKSCCAQALFSSGFLQSCELWPQQILLNSEKQQGTVLA